MIAIQLRRVTLSHSRTQNCVRETLVVYQDYISFDGPASFHLDMYMWKHMWTHHTVIRPVHQQAAPKIWELAHVAGLLTETDRRIRSELDPQLDPER